MKMNDRMNGFLWGAAVAAIVVPIGLSKGFGWYSAGQAQTFARQESQAAVVKVLTPFCVANFQKAADASDKLSCSQEDQLTVATRKLRPRKQVGDDRKGSRQRRDRCVRSGIVQAVIAQPRRTSLLPESL